MDAMSEIDRDLFREKYEDLKFMDAKYVRNIAEPIFKNWVKNAYFLYQPFFLQNNDETFANDATEITAEVKSDLDELIKQTVS